MAAGGLTVRLGRVCLHRVQQHRQTTDAGLRVGSGTHHETQILAHTSQTLICLRLDSKLSLIVILLQRIENGISISRGSL